MRKSTDKIRNTLQQRRRTFILEPAVLGGGRGGVGVYWENDVVFAV